MRVKMNSELNKVNNACIKFQLDKLMYSVCLKKTAFDKKVLQ